MTSITTNRLGQAPEEGVKAPVIVASVANLTLAGLPVISSTQLVAGDRVLAKDQVDTTENAIYIAAAGSWDRANDFNKSNDVINGQLIVDANSGQLYRTAIPEEYSPNITAVNFYPSEPSSIEKSYSTLDLARADALVQSGDVLHIKEISVSDGGETMIFDVVSLVSEDIPNGIWTGVADTNISFVMRDRGWLTADTIAELDLRTDIKIGAYISVDDYASGNNSGVLFFKIVAAATGTDDGGSYIDLSGSGLQARQNFPRIASVKMFGAAVDGVTDDSVPVQATIAARMDVLFPEGTCMCSFSQRHGQKIYGEGSRLGGTTLIPPALATHVIEIDATTSPKQHCLIDNIQIDNPNAVANCDGIHFKGTDVSTINDRHAFSNIAINDFRYGIKVTGRLIRAKFDTVTTSGCTRGWYSDTDPAEYSFNLNTWTNCRFGESTAEGFRHEGFNTINTFISLNIEGNNTDNVAGIAGMFVENAEGVSLVPAYFENNGTGVVVDAGDRMNNSLGLQLGGIRCFNLNVRGGWNVGSGTGIAIDDTVSIWGGSLKGSRYIALTNGIDIYINAKVDSHDRPTIQIDGDNNLNKGTEIIEQGTGRYAGSIKQVQGCSYITSASDVDLASTTSLVASSVGGFTISTINNRVPGCTFTLYNHGAGSITIDSTLMANGISEVIPSKGTKSYLILGFPKGGLLREIGSTDLTEVTTGITASASGAQGGSPLVSKVNEVATVGTSAHTVTLPSAVAGYRVTIINTSATAVKVYPASGDDLGAGVDTSVSLTAGSNITYVAYDATNWFSV